MDNSNTITKEQVYSWVEGMVEDGNSKMEIHQFLLSRKVDNQWIDLIMDDVYRTHFGEKFRKYRVWAIVLLVVGGLLMAGYFYESHQKELRIQAEVEKGNGITMSNGDVMVYTWNDDREILLRKISLAFLAGGLALGSVAYSNWNKYKIYKAN
ncbi:MAG: hypothetical protein IPL65_18130 [Lewinellaceae bacterium]|nr:hypothetical protein [Lewinellaceae bacterium]